MINDFRLLFFVKPLIATIDMQPEICVFLNMLVALCLDHFEHVHSFLFNKNPTHLIQIADSANCKYNPNENHRKCQRRIDFSINHCCQQRPGDKGTENSRSHSPSLIVSFNSIKKKELLFAIPYYCIAHCSSAHIPIKSRTIENNNK